MLCQIPILVQVRPSTIWRQCRLGNDQQTIPVASNDNQNKSVQHMKKIITPIRSTLAPVFGAMAVIAMTQTQSHAGGAAIARWNLGEQDSGAVAGNVGNATSTAAIGSPGNDLTGTGSPTYDANVPAGTGSTLSMAFSGGTYYRSDAVAALTNNFDYNNFGLSFDCYPTSNPGYNAPVSMGLYGGQSSFFYITGGAWHYNMNGGGDVALAAATLNAWSHLDFRRVQGTNYWYINGTQVGPTGNTTAGAGTFAPSVCIGGICARTSGGALFDAGGDWYGNVDNVVITNFNIGTPPILSGYAVSPNIVYTGNSIVFSASVSGDPNGLTFSVLTNGGTWVSGLSSLPYFINNATTNQNGNYSIIARNNFGSATSSIVAVAVQPTLGANVMWFKMGENDPGAVNGGAGDAETLDAILGSVLNWSQTGAPVYTNLVAPGTGSALSLAFDGSSYYQNTDLAAFLGELDQNNYSFSADVYCTAFGAAGFSFPISLGRNGVSPGGIAIVEIDNGVTGEWYAYRQSRGSFADLGPVRSGNSNPCQRRLGICKRPHHYLYSHRPR